jgi:hypothetical protein
VGKQWYGFADNSERLKIPLFGGGQLFKILSHLSENPAGEAGFSFSLNDCRLTTMSQTVRVNERNRDFTPTIRLCGLVSPEPPSTILVQASAFAPEGKREDIGHIRVGRTLPSLLRAACEKPRCQDWVRSNCTPHIPKRQRYYFPARVVL